MKNGVLVGGRRISNLRYTDDTVLTAENSIMLQEMLSKVSNISIKQVSNIKVKFQEN